MCRIAVRVVMAVVLGCVAVALPAQIGIRNISSASVDVYFNDDDAAAAYDGSVEKLALDINQVLLFGITDWLSVEVKVQRQDEEPFASPAPAGWHETTISLAPIFVTTWNTYMIVRYGLGIGTGYERPAGDEQDSGTVQGLSHDLTVDANYESPTTMVNLTVRGSLYPDLDYWFVLPSAGFKYLFPFGLDAGAKYFFSYNSAGSSDHAVIAETEYHFTPSLSAKAGGGASYAPEALPGRQWQYTALAGIGYRITPTLSVRYGLEYLGRVGLCPGLRNTLVLDAKF